MIKKLPPHCLNWTPLGGLHDLKPVVCGKKPLQSKNTIQIVLYPVHGTTNNEHQRRKFYFDEFPNHGPPLEYAKLMSIWHAGEKEEKITWDVSANNPLIR